MNNKLNQLVKKVEQWSINKGLNNGNSDRQAAALSRNDKALKDGIGDTVVTLIILAQQHNMSLEECLQCAYDEI